MANARVNDLERHGHGTGPAGLVPSVMQDIRDRLLFVEALETVRSLDQGVLTSVGDANGERFRHRHRARKPGRGECC